MSLMTVFHNHYSPVQMNEEMFLLVNVLTCHSKVLQDLGLPTGSESKSESGGESEGTQESVKAVTTSSTTSEDVCTSVPPSGVMYLEASFLKTHIQ